MTPPRMRIAHLTTADISLRYLLWAQLRAAVDAGHDVIAISAPGPHVAELEAAGIRHIPLDSSTRGNNLLADLRAAVDLWRVLRRERPDVLHTHNPKPGVYGRIVGRLARVHVVVNTQHGLYATEDDPPRKRLAVYAVEAIAARFSDFELVQNPEDLDLLRRLHIVTRSRARLLGNGVDVSRFDWHRAAIKGARARVRRELNVGDQQILVGIVGRLVAEKGYSELFEAMRELDEEYALVVVGPTDPDKADALSDEQLLAAEQSGVHFLGLRADVEALYQAMDIFVLPSHREGFPRAAMEAAAMQLPLVVSNVRGCREVVDDGVNGFLVPARDPAALAKAIRRLGEDSELRRQMGDNSGRIARKRFDERRVVDIVLKTYRDISRRKTLAQSARQRRWRETTAQSIKRATDVGGAAAGLTFAAPVFAVIAAAVRSTMGRPVLFRQERPGHHGQLFTIYKFRTMRVAVDAKGRPLPDEQRLTRVGRFLRATSLDELPELWNVLRGDMSLVGPRPLLVEYLDRYTDEEARRHTLRPGITGWAQINGRNNQMWHERLALDTWYVDHWTLALDMQILARTVRKVLRREGIAQDGYATMPKFMGTADRASHLGRAPESVR